MSTPVRRIVADLPVVEPGADAPFWNDLLGLETAMDLGWVVNHRAAGVTMPVQVQLVSRDATAPVEPAVSVEVDTPETVDALHARARAGGLRVEHPPTDEPWGVRRFLVRTPGGVVVNVLAHRCSHDGVRTLITGASSGLGEGMARAFAARGHDVALAARRTDRLEAVAAELTARPGAPRVVTAALDVTDDDAVAQVFTRVRADFGGLDRVVVNAGIGNGRPVGSGRPDANLRTARTNFVAALAQCEAAMEIFRAQGSGHLVVISSVAADRGLRGATAVYSATKAGLSTLAEGIRADVAGTPIDVTTIAPGFIRTDLNEGMAMPFAVDAPTGVRALVEAIERRPAHAYVPRWPWSLLGPALRLMPMPLVRALT